MFGIGKLEPPKFAGRLFMNETVCFISPPSRSINHYRPPVALLYLAGYLENKGIETEIIDITLKDQVRNDLFYKNIKRKLKKIEVEILDQVKTIKPDIIGITCYTPEFFEALSLAKKIKEIDSKIKIVVGGIHPTFFPEDFIFKNSPFDVAVLGEGEVTLLELVRKIKNEKDWNKIKSIAFFDSDKRKTMITPTRPLEMNLDSIATPAYHKVDMDYYSTANPYAIRGVFARCVYVLSSRGCPSQCTFCVAKKIKEFCGYKTYARLRSPRHLFKE